jgi:hypothetical protein
MAVLMDGTSGAYRAFTLLEGSLSSQIIPRKRAFGSLKKHQKNKNSEKFDRKNV